VSHGLDTSFLLAVEIVEHAHHADALRLLAELLTQGDRVAIAPRIQRHENLRTTFALEEGELVQRVSSFSAFRLEHRSFMSVPAGDRKKAVF
jgi:hypothetical protein